jgi:hypothetical protein
LSVEYLGALQTVLFTVRDVDAFFFPPLRSFQFVLVAVAESESKILWEFPASRYKTWPVVTTSEALESVGGPETTIVKGRLKVADTESVTVRVSRYVPTVKVSARRIRGNPTVEVSNVIPEIGGEREYR